MREVDLSWDRDRPILLRVVSCLNVYGDSALVIRQTNSEYEIRQAAERLKAPWFSESHPCVLG